MVIPGLNLESHAQRDQGKVSLFQLHAPGAAQVDPVGLTVNIGQLFHLWMEVFDLNGFAHGDFSPFFWLFVQTPVSQPRQRLWEVCLFLFHIPVIKSPGEFCLIQFPEILSKIS